MPPYFLEAARLVKQRCRGEFFFFSAGLSAPQQSMNAPRRTTHQRAALTDEPFVIV